MTETTSTKLPFVVLLLALGTFLMNTTEFVIAGLLPAIATDLGVGVAQAGLLITFFAVGMIIGAPTISVATARIPKRVTLVLALVLYAAGHLVAATSGSFEVVLASRVATAIATGAFLSVAAIVATTAAGPARATRAMGVMMSGMGLAIVAGVPLGSWLGQSIGWRGIFWILAALAVLVAAVIWRLAPREQASTEPVTIRSQASILRSGRMWLVLTATALISGGLLAVYSYVSPLLTDGAGIPEALVPLVLVGFGLGALTGTILAGRFGDRRPLTTFLAIGVATTVVVALIIPLTSIAAAVIPLIVLLGLTGMGVASIATPLAVRFGHRGPALAAALTVSAFNVGIAAGTWLAGSALESPLGVTGPALAAVGMLILGIIPLIVLAALRATTEPAATLTTNVAQETPAA